MSLIILHPLGQTTMKAHAVILVSASDYFAKVVAEALTLAPLTPAELSVALAVLFSLFA